MIEVMKKDGEHALKQYLPNVCRLMENPNQEPSTIITTVKKYCQVFQGGVKDQFMLYRKQYAPGLWQQVKIPLSGSLGKQGDLLLYPWRMLWYLVLNVVLTCQYLSLLCFAKHAFGAFRDT